MMRRLKLARYIKMFPFVTEHIRKKGITKTIKKSLDYCFCSPPKLPSVLSQLVIEVTSYCNLRCPGCLRSIKNEEGRQLNRHMSNDEFSFIVEHCLPAKTLSTQGIGEPTMHPHLQELIKIASQSGKFEDIIINSNGLFRPPDYYGELLQAGLSGISISIDSLDDKKLGVLRKGSNKEALLKCISTLHKAYPSKVSVRTVVSRMNLKELPMLFAELNKIGHLHVDLQPFVDYGDLGDWVLSPSERVHCIHECEAISEECPNISLSVSAFEPALLGCRMPWMSPAITVDGFLSPCCIMMDSNVIQLGNVLKHPFNTIWASVELEEFRKNFFYNYPSFCNQCPYKV
ncbi:MAG: radical SAM protein [Verrucomicrobiae bacterium]|nr:radical SAM protein [Verrucomicrobiae bacterium]